MWQLHSLTTAGLPRRYSATTRDLRSMRCVRSVWGWECGAWIRAEKNVVRWRPPSDQDGAAGLIELAAKMLLASLRRLGLRRTVSTPHARCMHLSPRELDHLQLAQVGFVAQRRLSRGVRLNAPEATALIATQMLEMIRDGTAVSTLMETGKQLLGRRQVQAGVADMVAEVQVEGTFPDGTKLLTVCPSRAPRPPAPAPVAAPASPASLCQRESRTRSPAPFSSRPAQPTASDLTLPARLAALTHAGAQPDRRAGR